MFGVWCEIKSLAMFLVHMWVLFYLGHHCSEFRMDFSVMSRKYSSPCLSIDSVLKSILLDIRTATPASFLG